MGGGTRSLRKNHGEPYTRYASLGISLASWLANWVFSFILFVIDTKGKNIAYPGLGSFLLWWWAYANLREKYRHNCFKATGTPKERDYYANILDITLTMSRDEIIKKYVARKKTSTTPEEQQKVELAYTFFIEPKKYGKVVKNNNLIINIFNSNNHGDTSQIDALKNSIDISLISKDEKINRSCNIGEYSGPNRNQPPSSYFSQPIENKFNESVLRNQNASGINEISWSKRKTILTLTSICLVLFTCLFIVREYKKPPKKMYLDFEIETLNDAIAVAEEYIENAYASSLRKQITTNKLKNIIANKNLDDTQKKVIIKEEILKDNIIIKKNEDFSENTKKIIETEHLENVVLLAEKHIENKYTTPLAQKLISDKLEKIVTDQYLNNKQKIEIIKKEILIDNSDISNDATSKYFNKQDNEIVSNIDEAVSLCNKGIKLLEGKEVSKDVNMAFECFFKAAKMGNARAQAYLGECYIWGRGTQKNENEAIIWIKKSAFQGDAMGERLLAWSYDMGMGVIQDEKQAFDLYKQAASDGDEDALDRLAFYYTIGKGTTINPNKAFECYKKLADKGNYLGICELGKCYLCGYGTSKNESEAFRLFLLAAENNEPMGYYFLGYCFYLGISTQVNYSFAFKCFSNAANNDYFPAYDWLGLCYTNGQGVEQDSKKAFTWYMKAAEMKDKGGEFHVGLSYYLGQGVDRDEQVGINWLKKAAKHGEINAQKMLSRLNINYK